MALFCELMYRRHAEPLVVIATPGSVLLAPKGSTTAEAFGAIIVDDAHFLRFVHTPCQVFRYFFGTDS